MAEEEPHLVALTREDLDQVLQEDLGEYFSHHQAERRRDAVKDRCEAGLFIVFIIGGFVLTACRLDAWVPYIAGIPSARIIFMRVFGK